MGKITVAIILTLLPPLVKELRIGQLGVLLGMVE